MIPKLFIRIWLGKKTMPSIFEKWWVDFQELHPGYKFVTISEKNQTDFIPTTLLDLYADVSTYAGRSDILRIFALYELGGVYVDTDVMPLKSFEPLLADNSAFAARRSGRSFESAVLGAPAKHPATAELIKQLPAWYKAHSGRSTSVQTGPAFVSSVWFGRKDVRHLPPNAFYPYNGFRAPKREEKIKLFEENKFPASMYAAHFSNNRWGGKPTS